MSARTVDQGAASAELDRQADLEPDPARAMQLRDDAYTARAFRRQRDRDVLRLRRLLRQHAEVTS